MAKRHIAGSGAKAGQWVACDAKNCRLGGTHISERDFYAVKAWRTETDGKMKSSDITEKDYADFKAATAGKEKEWAVKAEKLARKDKGLKQADVQVFDGEKNLVEVPKKKTATANWSKPVAKPAVVSPATTSPNKQMPSRPMRLIEHPEARSYILTGNTKSLRQLIDNGIVNEYQVQSLIHTRVQMVNHGEVWKTRFTNNKTGENHQLIKIPEVQDYFMTGSETSLNKAKEDYSLSPVAVETVIGIRKQEQKKAKKEAKALSRQNKKPGLFRKIFNNS